MLPYKRQRLTHTAGPLRPQTPSRGRKQPSRYLLGNVCVGGNLSCGNLGFSKVSCMWEIKSFLFRQKYNTNVLKVSVAPKINVQACPQRQRRWQPAMGARMKPRWASLRLLFNAELGHEGRGDRVGTRGRGSRAGPAARRSAQSCCTPSAWPWALPLASQRRQPRRGPRCGHLGRERGGGAQPPREAGRARPWERNLHALRPAGRRLAQRAGWP